MLSSSQNLFPLIWDQDTAQHLIFHAWCAGPLAQKPLWYNLEPVKTQNGIWKWAQINYVDIQTPKQVWTVLWTLRYSTHFQLTSSRSTGSLNISLVSLADTSSKTFLKLASKGFSSTLRHLSLALIYSTFSFSLFLTSSQSSRALSKSCRKHCQYFNCLHNSRVSTLLVFESLGPPKNCYSIVKCRIMVL